MKFFSKSKFNYGEYAIIRNQSGLNSYKISVKEWKKNKVYSSEADILNVALFGMTAKEWKSLYKGKEGNIRDYANSSQLVCLVNLENFNALFIKGGFSQPERLVKLNDIAISQMKILIKEHPRKLDYKKNKTSR